jgi:hypothetical protein
MVSSISNDIFIFVRHQPEDSCSTRLHFPGHWVDNRNIVQEHAVPPLVGTRNPAAEPTGAQAGELHWGKALAGPNIAPWRLPATISMPADM